MTHRAKETIGSIILFVLLFVFLIIGFAMDTSLETEKQYQAKEFVK